MGKFKIVLLLLALVLVVVGLAWWWQHEASYPSTDDAFLQSNIISVTPQISGSVVDVMVIDNQRVNKGDVLFRMDGTSLNQALVAANAQLTQAKENAVSAGDTVASAEATVVQTRAALTDAEAEFSRNEKLFKAGYVSGSAMDLARSQRDEAAAQHNAATASLASAKSLAGKSTPENPGVLAAMAALNQAEINLSYATVTAPADGWIANLTLRPGQAVAQFVPLFSLVEDGDWWIDANFKETDLQNIRPGQEAYVSIDMYPGTDLKGSVVSIGAGSGAVFSLLPPQNATGNWVKITQRFTVRVKIDKSPADPARQLRVGASVTVVVDTTKPTGNENTNGQRSS
jgi:membrane fusion protein (multidrug efflux system)